ncbi:MAG: hypothetical protein ABFS17_02690 [Chloroflexota bacterium]
MVRKKYSDDYEVVVKEDEKGREKRTAVYRGDYFEVDLDQKGIVQFKNTCLLLISLIIVFHIGAGFVTTQGANQFYISLPYAFVYFPMIYLADSIWRCPKENRKFTRKEIGLSYERIKTTSHIVLSFLLIGIAGEIIFLLFFSDVVNYGMDYLYLALEILVGILILAVIKLQKQISIIKSA